MAVLRRPDRLNELGLEYGVEGISTVLDDGAPAPATTETVW